jgi:hypothetical protein
VLSNRLVAALIEDASQQFNPSHLSRMLGSGSAITLRSTNKRSWPSNQNCGRMEVELLPYPPSLKSVVTFWRSPPGA